MNTFPDHAVGALPPGKDEPCDAVGIRRRFFQPLEGGIAMQNLIHNRRLILGAALAILIVAAIVLIVAFAGGGGGSVY